ARLISAENGNTLVVTKGPCWKAGPFFRSFNIGAMVSLFATILTDCFHVIA
ncbi:MAG: hypothetical protein ACI81Q_000889, partial [Paracoccaceae bacterium]